MLCRIFIPEKLWPVFSQNLDVPADNHNRFTKLEVGISMFFVSIKFGETGSDDDDDDTSYTCEKLCSI